MTDITEAVMSYVVLNIILGGLGFVLLTSEILPEEYRWTGYLPFVLILILYFWLTSGTEEKEKDKDV